ncbi:TetR/AcrR family transcriptional regulator C-terminal domain-containing protein [Streptosporangium longisporum]|uniref:GntR family transcriptional regulator n=1 Tax=Streptosporangium longisporum TaxID=46187 RepID=A0ABN3Y614_9ACTN
MAADIDPPYLRIVAEIRRRIADGELSPGDRVPSTRQIAARWGVALATATRALTTLRQEGTVETRPRVGTVVAAGPARARRRTSAASPPAPASSGSATSGSAISGPRHRVAAPGPDGELTRERIVRAAIEIADEEGLAALSMRGVAARLGVSTMSPYRHVNGKDDLVLLMADAAFGEETHPGGPGGPGRLGHPPGPGTSGDWRPRLEMAARALWTLYRRHPWLAHIGPLHRPLTVPSLLVYAEWVLSALDGHGLEPATMLDLHILLYNYVQGIAVNLERETQAEAVSGLSDEQWWDANGPAIAAVLASGRYPTFARVTAAVDGYDLDLDELFEFGLGPLLNGVAAIVEARSGDG